MPRTERLSATDRIYCDTIRNSIRFTDHSRVIKTINFLTELWRIIILNLSSYCDDAKIAEVFSQEFMESKRSVYELSYNLSFLTEKQMRQLRLLHCRRNLDIVNIAIFMTSLVHKQKALIQISKTLSANVPPLPAEIIKDGPVQIPQQIWNLDSIVMATPTERVRNITNKSFTLNLKELVARDFDCLESRIPEFNYVQACTRHLELFDNASVSKLLAKLKIRSLLYLYEVSPKYRLREIAKLISERYRGFMPKRRRAFREYIEVNTMDSMLRDHRYIFLIAEMRTARKKGLPA